MQCNQSNLRLLVRETLSPRNALPRGQEYAQFAKAHARLGAVVARSERRN